MKKTEAEKFVQEYLKFYYNSVVMQKKDMFHAFDDLAEKAIAIVEPGIAKVIRHKNELA
jgi:hypothetical protein